MRLTKFMGICFIVLGVIGCIAIVASFDYSYYNDIKHLTLTYAEEIEFMKEELTLTWAVGLIVLITNVAFGTLLITLDSILGELIRIRNYSKDLSAGKDTGPEVTA